MAADGAASAGGPPSLADIERYCTAMYSASDEQQRRDAEGRVLQLSKSTRFIPLLQQMLEQSRSAPTLLVATKSLSILFKDFWTTFTAEQRVQIRDYVLNLLAQRGPSQDKSVTVAQIHLVAQITKNGWFDDGAKLRDIVDQVRKFLDATNNHAVIGLELLNDVVEVMNTRQPNLTLTRHRKAAVSFRDHALGQIAEIAFSTLEMVALRRVKLQGLEPATARNIEERMLAETVRLITHCLDFDFIGTNPDDASEEIGTIQVPSAWRDRFQGVTGTTTLFMLFNVYIGLSTGSMPQGPAPSESARAAEMAATAAAAAGGLSGTGPFGGGVQPSYAVPRQRRSAGDAAAALAATQPTGPAVQMWTSAERAAEVLQAITLFASVRRSVFTMESMRRAFLTTLLRGVVGVLENKVGIADQSCFHAFCRLLGRLKANYQLSELVRTEGYAKWLDLAAEFTVRAFQMMDWSGESAVYLMELWSRMVAAVPYVRLSPLGDGMAGMAGAAAAVGGGGAAMKLQEHAPRIVSQYVRARLGLVAQAIAGEVDNPLDEAGSVEAEVSSITGVCRYRYDMVAKGLRAIMDPLLVQYRQLLSASRTASFAAAGASGAASVASSPEGRQLEQQLAWVVYIVSAVVGGQTFGNSLQSEEDVKNDASLLKRVLELISMVDAAVTASTANFRCDHRLEMAFLYFISSFRYTFMSEQHGMPNPRTEASAAAQRNLIVTYDEGGSKPPTTGPTIISQKQRMFEKLFDHIGRGDHRVVISELVNKMCNNLRFLGQNNDILDKTLSVLYEMVYTYSSGRLLNSLEAVDFLLTHHGPSQFPFLNAPERGRQRTKLYTCLARLLFLSEDADDKFETFFAPIAQQIDQVAAAATNRTPAVATALAGIGRDLRGILAASHNRKTYTLVFDALFPTRVQLFSVAIEAWADTPQVTTPLLKAFSELVLNRTSRVNFGSASANGVVLFKAAEQLLQRFMAASAKVPQPSNPGDMYPRRYKAVGVAMNILARALDGGYCPFGVFALYQDKTLEGALVIAIKLCNAVPQKEIANFPKLARAYYHMLSVLFRSHLKKLAELPPKVFQSLVASLRTGLESFDVLQSTYAASAVDCLATTFVTANKAGKKSKPEYAAILRQCGQLPKMFEAMLNWLFGAAIFNDQSKQNQWSISRPLLSLIVASSIVNPKAFHDMRDRLVAGQPEAARPPLQEEFRKLMQQVTRSLDIANRDRFAQRLVVFRLAVKQFAVTN